MTGKKWLTSSDPWQLLAWIEGVKHRPLRDTVSDHLVSNRKLLLLKDAWDSPLCGDERFTIADADLLPGALGECQRVLAGITRRYEETAVDILRDIVGNPFDPYHYRQSCTEAERMARSAYDTQEFCLLPFVADALEEDGCPPGALLNHLRSPGPHVRGCWAVDAILGQE
jgi:hypothetical protein